MRAETSWLRVEWHHGDSDTPVLLFAALDADRLEVRKIEVWADGSAQVSDSVGDQDHQKTSLGIVPVPPLTVIQDDAQFTARSIEAAEFQTRWSRHATPDC